MAVLRRSQQRFSVIPSPLRERVRVRVKSLRQRGPGYTKPRPLTRLTAQDDYFAIVLLGGRLGVAMA